ncbi:LacI family DNA-binding transcriptional regulator [Pseudoduganella aquatica]|nr:LacI family DNA-binding transcriptional regulator [Pseudoduganella aquatica]
MSSKTVSASRVTLADIAEGCGVSRATVSLVVRNSPLVHADTRAKVEAEFKRQGYVYNRGAANLRQGRSSIVALVINDLSNPFFAEFAAGVDEALGEAGYAMLLGSTSESVARQQAVLSSLMEHRPAGIILSPAEGSEAGGVAGAVGSGTPMLLFNRDMGGCGWDFLSMDNQAGARMATEHLLAQGHRRIAFYGGFQVSSSCRQRRLGYAEAMAAAGIAPEPHWLIETAPTRLEAARQVAALFANDPALTAAVAYNDAVALGLMLGLAGCGRQAGRDFAVTGFDDIPEAAVSVPPLTTVATDPRELGRQAARRLLERIAEPAQATAAIVAPVRLAVRLSSSPPL